MTVKEREAKKEPSKLEAPVRLTMIGLNEFINTGSLSRTYKVETLGGFLTWVKGKAPSKLPFESWRKMLDEFANRIV
jgi:hypothetical protein